MAEAAPVVVVVPASPVVEEADPASHAAEALDFPAVEVPAFPVAVAQVFREAAVRVFLEVAVLASHEVAVALAFPVEVAPATFVEGAPTRSVLRVAPRLALVVVLRVSVEARPAQVAAHRASSDDRHPAPIAALLSSEVRGLKSEAAVRARRSAVPLAARVAAHNRTSHRVDLVVLFQERPPVSLGFLWDVGRSVNRQPAILKADRPTEQTWVASQIERRMALEVRVRRSEVDSVIRAGALNQDNRRVAPLVHSPERPPDATETSLGRRQVDQSTTGNSQSRTSNRSQTGRVTENVTDGTRHSSSTRIGSNRAQTRDSSAGTRGPGTPTEELRLAMGSAASSVEAIDRVVRTDFVAEIGAISVVTVTEEEAIETDIVEVTGAETTGAVDITIGITTGTEDSPSISSTTNRGAGLLGGADSTTTAMAIMDMVAGV